jgi:hypothetical protein
MISKWDNPYKVNAFRSAIDVLVLYEEHIRNTPRLWQGLYEVDTGVILPLELVMVLQRLRQEQRDHAESVSRRSNRVDPNRLR